MKIQGKVWGFTSPMFNKNNVEVHYCEIDKGGFCSKHKHESKFNRFIILSGCLKVTIYKEYIVDKTLEDITFISAGDECTVSPGDYHRFEALQNTKLLEIYWVELDSKDIIRLDQGGIKNETKTNLSTANIESSTPTNGHTDPEIKRFFKGFGE